MANYQDINFPASGYGEQSPYYDEELLFDGSYQVTSVTISSACLDEENPEDENILRAGLLLTLAVGGGSVYGVANTANGYLNGDLPLQTFHNIVVLAKKTYMNKVFIMGGTRVRTVTPVNQIVPAYLSCNIYENKVYYNNKSNQEILQYQWDDVQRIRLVPRGSNRSFNDKLRALLWNRVEETVGTL